MHRIAPWGGPNRDTKKGEGPSMLFLVIYFLLFLILIFQGTHIAGEVKTPLGTLPEEVGQNPVASARWGVLLIWVGSSEPPWAFWGSGPRLVAALRPLCFALGVVVLALFGLWVYLSGPQRPSPSASPPWLTITATGTTRPRIRPDGFRASTARPIGSSATLENDGLAQPRKGRPETGGDWRHDAEPRNLMRWFGEPLRERMTLSPPSCPRCARAHGKGGPKGRLFSETMGTRASGRWLPGGPSGPARLRS